MRLFSDGTRNRRGPGTRASALGHDRCRVYGHKDGLALTFDVHRPAQPNGAGVIAIVSGGWQSSVEMSRLIVDGYLSPLLNEKGFTVFAVRHGSSPRYPMSAIVADMRRAVRFIRQHAGEYGVDPTALACMAAAPAGSSRCCSRDRISEMAYTTGH